MLTRTGLVTSINWINLGIDEVYQAQDGVDGYHVAMNHKPDIILSDVRMPRMTGIEMLEKIRQELPDTVFIFMSGYSDKEYLKAAIKLQAVSYVEKPLDIEEVSEVVREAIDRCQSIRQNRDAESLSDSISANHLATCLTIPYRSVKDSIQSLSQDYCRKYGSAEMFHAAFTLILQIEEETELAPDFLRMFEDAVHERLRTLRLHVISTEKKTNLFVFHMFKKDTFSETTIQQAVNIFCSQLAVLDIRDWYITCGSIVSGIHKLYESYSSAVISLQHSYFFEPTTVLLENTPLPAKNPVALDRISDDISGALKAADAKALEQLCQKMYDAIYQNPALLRRSVQTLYYQMITVLLEQRRQRQLSDNGLISNTAEALDIVNRSFSFGGMHRYFVELVQKYLDDINQHVPENSSVYLIKQYIQKHYGNPMLSTKEISEYAALSASYACTVFKNETGQTLNQYLTEYRLERAKELLADPRNNVSDVASQVGYNDSNYFGKAFKKYVGASPSDYRENRVV